MMGLNSEITADLAEAFDGDLSDAVSDILYTQKAQISYDPDTGLTSEYAPQWATRGVKQPLTKSMLDGEVLKIGDFMVTILQSELEMEPDVGDSMEISDETHEINVTEYDPVQVAWVLYTRVV